MPYAGQARPAAGPVLEGWTVLTAVAARTTRIRLGTLVLGASYRHPAVVAKMAATLDQVSGGRLTLGLGAVRVLLAAYTAAGADEFVLRDHRAQALPDALRAVDRLVSGGPAAPG